jgi:multiple sugar transport system permease protein
MMRNIISITVLFSLIVTFANFDIVRVLTNGGPRDQTHVFATYAFQVGILSATSRAARRCRCSCSRSSRAPSSSCADVNRRNKEQM